MANFKFHDYSIEVKEAMDKAIFAALEEGAAEIESAAKKNSRVDTGQTKGAWDYSVDEAKLESTIGSPLENAIWEEFGTGEFALAGDGRKGGWYYVDADGIGHHTRGKTANRALWNAYQALKGKLIKRAEMQFGGLNSK